MQILNQALHTSVFTYQKDTNEANTPFIYARVYICIIYLYIHYIVQCVRVKVLH